MTASLMLLSMEVAVCFGANSEGLVQEPRLAEWDSRAKSPAERVMAKAHAGGTLTLAHLLPNMDTNAATRRCPLYSLKASYTLIRSWLGILGVMLYNIASTKLEAQM